MFNAHDLSRIGKAVRKAETTTSIDSLSPKGYGSLPYLFARITSVDAADTSKCAWQQVIRQEDGSYKDGPLSGTLDNNPAFEISKAAVTVSTELQYILFRMPVIQDSGPIKINWAFSIGAVESKGKYQGQVHTMLSDLSDGWDYYQLHSV